MVGRRSIACPYQITSQKETPDANTLIITRVSAPIYGLGNTNPKYKCIICDSRFYHKRSLEAHKLRHTDTLPKLTFPPNEQKCSRREDRTTNKTNTNKSEPLSKNVWMVRLANIKRRLLNSFKFQILFSNGESPYDISTPEIGSRAVHVFVRIVRAGPRYPAGRSRVRSLSVLCPLVYITVSFSLIE